MLNRITSVDHVSGTVGKYFNFREHGSDRYVHDEVIYIRNQRTGEFGKAKVWSTNNGGSTGNHHGRWDHGAHAGQWVVGDYFEKSWKRTAWVLSVDHVSNTRGKYFNFDIASFNRALNEAGMDPLRPLANGDVVWLVHVRTGQRQQAKVWMSTNGGTEGDGHGRWSEGAKENDWQRGDLFEPVIP